MNFSDLFSPDTAALPFNSYAQYTEHLFACVDRQLSAYLTGLTHVFTADNGSLKNTLYPDLEIARNLCQKHVDDFLSSAGHSGEHTSAVPAAETETDGALDALLAAFADDISAPLPAEDAQAPSVADMLSVIRRRAACTAAPLPLHTLAETLGLSDFSLFCFACAVLSSTQTNYAAIFQVIGQNSSLVAPSIESAARVYFGEQFSITAAYAEMSRALEQLAPVFDLRINASLPFSTIVSPDKRLIDFLFGADPLRIDQKYKRFFSVLTDGQTLDPLLANQHILDALTISFDDGVRLFSLYGDEGSGRRFTIRHFCAQKNLRCITVDGAKLFGYDFQFVQQALWAVARECLLSGACCCLTNLSYREEEKERFFSYMDLFFERLSDHGVTVFTHSKDKLPMREMTSLDFTQLELPTPDNRERIVLWQHYAEGYALDDEVDLTEMATKFLFTGGKIKNALHQARSFASMAQALLIPRDQLFKACNAQMSHELTQKATRIPANFTWDDIVMNRDQREALQHAVEQMTYRKQVYEDWNYMKKYQYGRGLSVLLFGAPGTGKSMCAQVIANALNLELYRVDLSKVVDKYVGETEKSISMIFREAKKCNVVLFFDECDTLFAKRSDDGGSNQSSNNNKTALLLQEVEAYDGVSVLATNYKHNIDPAFFRRMKFIVEFQFPDADTREMLWKTTIPKTTPLAEDVDIRFLAERFEFVGGNIKNCILNAAFLAAADPDSDGNVHMKHYLQAIRYEFVKTGKVFTRADFEPYAHLVLG
ncbi:MAG: ATP-binding protein [Agathobaculum sp.]|uniref:ATP-binding protein n=1 Tax=Agathobaculum sp. TaxID=2048138 RepID=UPI0025C54F10|nr:ATP-binding protein [Agathobaculum sp.]MDY3711661.1 ATP-binding protein [Agathobaculum sp.]